MAAGTASAQNAIVNDRPGTFVDISTMGAHSLVNGVYFNNGFRTFTTTVTNGVFASTDVGLCSNGFIQFGGGDFFWADPQNITISPGTTSPIEPATTQTLFLYWDDLFIPEGYPAEVYWKEDAATAFGLPAALGNVLIVQWHHVPHYHFGIPDGEATFQVQIYQNIVNNVAAQIIYSDVVFNSLDYDKGATATVGFASGTTGGPSSVNNVLYSYDAAGSINNGDVLSLLTSNLSLAASGAVTPGTFVSPGDAVLYAVTVSPAEQPTSTGIMVHANLSAVGGPASAVFHDDGLDGDAAAGDNLFSYAHTIPVGHAGGGNTLPVIVTDAQSRSASASIFSSVVRDVGTIGSTLISTTLNFGGPSEVQWLRFTTLAGCDPTTNFLDIDTEGTALSGAGSDPNATVIGLFGADSVLYASDYHSGSGSLSQISCGAIGNPRPAVGNGLPYTGSDAANGNYLIPGTYYLAVGIFDMVFTPVGFGATHFDSTLTTGSAGTITVNFNSNLPGAAGCGPADIDSLGGTPGADGQLTVDDLVYFLQTFFAGDTAHADIASLGGTPGPDGQITVDDLVYFLQTFFAGC